MNSNGWSSAFRLPHWTHDGRKTSAGNTRDVPRPSAFHAVRVPRERFPIQDPAAGTLKRELQRLEFSLQAAPRDGRWKDRSRWEQAGRVATFQAVRRPTGKRHGSSPHRGGAAGGWTNGTSRHAAPSPRYRVRAEEIRTCGAVSPLGDVSPGRRSLELLHGPLCVAGRKSLLIPRRPGHPAAFADEPSKATAPSAFRQQAG